MNTTAVTRKNVYLRYLLSEKWLFLALIGISIVLALLLGSYTYFLKDAYGNVYNIFSEEQMYRTCFFLFVSIGFYFAMNSVRSYLVSKIKYSLLRDIQFAYMEELFSYNYAFFVKTRTDDLMKRMAEDSGYLANGLSQIAFLVSNMLIAFLWVISFSIFVSWVFFVFAGAVLILILWIIVWHRPIIKSSYDIGISYGVLYGLFWKMVSGIKVIKLELLSNRIEKELSDASRQMEKNFRKNMISNNGLYSIINPLQWTVFMIMLYFGVHELKSGNFTFGLLTVCLMFVFRMLDPLFETMPIIMSIRESKVALERMKNFFVSESEKSGNVIFPGLKDEIVYENVHFSYPEGAFRIDNLNLSIRRGETVAFIGKSGAGKSTIVNMLLRLQRQSSGRILLDGLDIDEYSVHTVREKIVLIPQDSTFFAASIWDNINLKNSADESAVNELLAELGLAELIKKLPNGLREIIRVNGNEFSGGERQRLALARGLLVNAGCYVFDEITANVDPITESIILDSIFNRKNIETKIFITHNIKILSRIDRIFLLGDSQGLIELDNKNRKVDIDKLIDYCSSNYPFPGELIYRSR